MQICENDDVMHMHIMCFVYRSAQAYITNYWPGMYNTAFLVGFTDPCEWALFRLRCKNAKRKTLSLSCKNTISYL